MSAGVDRRASTIEPAPLAPATLVVEALGAVTWGGLLVAPFAFLSGVLVLVGVEEVVGPASAAVDVAARATLAALVLVAAGAGVLEPLRRATARLLRMRTALRLARDAAPMPPAVEREQLALGPTGPIRGLLIGLAIATGVVGCVLVIMGIDEEEGAYALIGLGLLAAMAACILGARALRRAAAWWSNLVGRLVVAWPRFRASDTAKGVTLVRQRTRFARDRHLTARRRQPRADRVVMIVTIVGVCIAFVGVLLRQRCRTCEPVAYDPLGESFVDVVALVGLALVVLSIAAWLVRALVVWSVHVVRELSTLSALRSGVVERTPWLDRALQEPRSVELLGRALGVVAAVMVTLWVASTISADFLDVEPDALGVLPSWAAFGLPALVATTIAVAATAMGIVVTRAWRRRVHAVLSADPFAGVLDRR